MYAGIFMPRLDVARSQGEVTGQDPTLTCTRRDTMMETKEEMQRHISQRCEMCYMWRKTRVRTRLITATITSRTSCVSRTLRIRIQLRWRKGVGSPEVCSSSGHFMRLFMAFDVFSWRFMAYLLLADPGCAFGILVLTRDVWEDISPRTHSLGQTEAEIGSGCHWIHWLFPRGWREDLIQNCRSWWRGSHWRSVTRLPWNKKCRHCNEMC